MINWFIACRKLKLKVITFLSLPDRNVETSVSEILQVPCKALHAMAILHCLEVFFHPEVKCRFYTFKVGCSVVRTEVAENYEENSSHFCAVKKNTLLSELCRFPIETCHKAHFFNKPFVSSFIRNNLIIYFDYHVPLYAVNIASINRYTDFSKGKDMLRSLTIEE